ncbi:MAG: enoyl-CoA hydratase/isomerase family protein [Variovorax sp.]|nr:enoyl-CoA hydratase/isomerase family protein [Variovorax sp.]
MELRSLRYEKHGRVGVMTFDTPAALNAISELRLAEMELLLTGIEADTELGALIITGGEGRAFCVGLDLELLERAFGDMIYFETVVRRLNVIISRLEALAVPTIAAVNGITRAGGFELTMGCDFVLIADDARYGDVHTDSGVLPAAASLRLKRRIGEQRAKEMIWTARWYTGPEAVAAGLALRSVPRGELQAEALAFAARMTDKPRAVIAASKRVFQQGVDAGLAEGAEIELRNFVAYMDSEPYGHEGYKAFREGRQPSWKP